MMKKYFSLIVLSFLAFSLFSQVKELPYSKEAMDIGNMYSYEVKEKDGKNKMYFHFYVESEDSILFYNDFSPLAPFVFIGRGEYSKNTSSFSHTFAYNPFSYMALPYNKTSDMKIDAKEKKVLIDVSYFNKAGKEKNIKGERKLDIVPSYENTLYQLDLWFALRNYKGDYSPFEIGGMMNGRIFTNIVSFMGEDIVKGENCEVWEIREKGMFGKPSKDCQTIYMSKDDIYKKVILYTNTQKIQPVGKLEVSLLERKAMTKAEWDSFVENKNEEVRIKLKFPKKN